MITEILLEMLEQRRFSEIRTALSELNPVDIAGELSSLPEHYLPIVFRLLPKELAAEIFVEMDSDGQELLLSSFSDTELRSIMDELFVDDAVELIEEMPANVVSRILAQSSPSARKAINEILKYPEDSAGSIMTIEYVGLKESMTVAEAFERIRRTGVDKETIYTCYVTDGSRRLLGVVTARTLLLSNKEMTIGEIMDRNVIYALTTTDKETVAGMFKKYGFLALPVVDNETRLVGIITIDDAVDVMEEETTEDISKMAAITPTEKPYLKTSVFQVWLSRVPWLLILMISATFTAFIIESNEQTLAFSITLTASIPMLMGTAGNAGSQAAVTVIQGIALEEIRFKDIFRVLWKEIRVSVLLGATLAVGCFVKLLLLNGLWDEMNIALVISLAMFATIVIAKVVGCTMPLVAKKLRLDPAVVASPFITTIVDALALIVYCNVALALLS